MFSRLIVLRIQRSGCNNVKYTPKSGDFAVIDGSILHLRDSTVRKVVERQMDRAAAGALAQKVHRVVGAPVSGDPLGQRPQANRRYRYPGRRGAPEQVHLRGAERI